MELLVAFAIMTFVLVILMGLVQMAGNAWQGSRARIESFQAARAAFDVMTRRLGQTTLNNYYGYYPNSSSPTKYVRKSELHFICGKALLSSPRQVTHAIFFQSPLGYTDNATYDGLDSLLNACGYFVMYGNDASRPQFLKNLPDRFRYRLMQFSQPTQDLSVYQYVSGADRNKWFTGAVSGTNPPIRQMADNVIALIIRPKLSKGDEEKVGKLLSEDFEYDTRDGGSPATENQLPPLVEVVMVAIDEPSAVRLGNSPTSPDLGQDLLFKEAGKLEEDLAAFEDVLNAKPGNVAGNTIKLTYHIFRTEVPLRSAKWSAYD